MSILKTKNNNSRMKNLKKALENPKNDVRLNLIMDANLHKKFKIKAAMEGVTMTELMSDMIEDYIHDKR